MQLGETFFTENRLCCTHTHFFLPPCCCWPLSCDWAHLFREKFLQDVKLLFKLKSFSLSSCLLSLSPSIFLPLSIKKIILESLLLKPKHANSLFTLSRTKSFWLSFLPDLSQSLTPLAEVLNGTISQWFSLNIRCQIYSWFLTKTQTTTNAMMAFAVLK